MINGRMLARLNVYTCIVVVLQLHSHVQVQVTDRVVDGNEAD